MSPGFVSSVLALLLLLPFKGAAVLQPVGSGHFFNMNRPDAKKDAPYDDDIIEGEYTVAEPDGNQRRNAIGHKRDGSI